MAAAKPEVVLSHLVDYTESTFQHPSPYFRNLGTRGTIPETPWCNRKWIKQYGGR